MVQFNKTSFMFHLSLPVYLLLYFMFNNLTEYSLLCYLNSFLIVAFYFIISVVIYFILPEKYSLYVYCTLLGIAFYVILMSTYIQHQPQVGGGALSILICYFILSLCIIVRHFSLDKIALTLVLIMCALHVGTHIKNITPSSFETYENLPKFVHKPNVYLFIMESYQGQEALKKLYEFSNMDFYDYLKQKQFKIYDDFYSLYPTTRASVFSLLTYKATVGISTARVSDIIKQKKPSFVLDTFKNNGYSIEYLFPNEYLVHSQKHLFTGFIPQMQIIKKYHTDTDYLKDVMSKIDTLDELSPPFLSIIKIGGITEDNHTYSGGVAHIQNNLRWSDEVEKIPYLKKNYIKEMLKQNELMIEIIQKTINNDPDAVIILVGDHGPFFYDIWKKTASYELHNVSKEDYILDRYNVLCAIRWPQNIISSQNIHFVPEVFQLIIAELSQNKLKTENVNKLYDFSNIEHDISNWELSE